MGLFFNAILISVLALSLPFLSSLKRTNSLSTGSSLSSQDVLISKPHGNFTAGFFRVGENAYCFSIWFTELYDHGNYIIVWMANRDRPVNGKHSRLSLLKSGNLVLADAGQFTVWTSSTQSNSFLQLQLHDNGNLVLSNIDGGNLWQSFDCPTNTLLPGQSLTQNSVLISSRSLTNYSSGFYKLYFDDDNVLSLLYDGPQRAGISWPDPWKRSWDNGRSTYNNSKVATLDSWGRFQSSDQFDFITVDYGPGIQRRLTIDFDGNLRVYSLDMASRNWKVTWQSSLQPCKVHGICGENSLCTYAHETGRKCTCAPGYKIKSQKDWAYGCEPDFQLPCNDSNASGFLLLQNVEFYGYDIGFFSNSTLDNCQNLCLNYCSCKGFQFKFDNDNGYYNCFPKTNLFNGYRSIGFDSPIYLRLPQSMLTSFDQKPLQQTNLKCTADVVSLNRAYQKKGQYGWVKSFLWCTLAVGAFEIICFFTYLFKTRRGSSARKQGYTQVATGFRKFTFAELKKASRNFSAEIGRGGGGIVYKGVLTDDRVAAIKCLNEANQGEAEFLAELSTIGKLNHMNLIEIWGYCVEGKHRLLVYEYMEHGSLAKNLHSGRLDWKKRYDIALGIAKGLSYLHEECLEWVLHCDVKPQNILLDSNYQPKVADFGLSKLLNRGGTNKSTFSGIRGTRGYMAPEWVFNLPITSKVDVYSYGIVVLELLTGRSPVEGRSMEESTSAMEPRRLVTWVKEKMHAANGRASQTAIGKIVDPAVSAEFDVARAEILVQVALQCLEEDKDARPTMSRVVDTLLHQESDEY
ncbi:putative receptor protein kinase ZmPK1 [Coffea arabica]|uniref:Receptor-like serine/threonine-protein kinase n=1 Tax=Coffea arabica TaxID=13443 RepID=A0ABM4U1Q9_COFAR